MEKLLTGAIAATALMLCSGCSDTFNPSSDQEGRIFLDVSLNKTVKAPKSETPQSKAAGSAAEISVNDLQLKLTADDGSLQRTWSSLTQFDATEDFPVGGYTFEAYYGNAADEGFEKPYYYGTTSLRIQENKTTPVELTATLGNSMVTLRYTERALNYFAKVNGMINTVGGKVFDYPDDETRPVYVRPGLTTVDVDFTSPTGAHGTQQILSFETVARHHYIVTVDKSDAGNAVFNIILSQELSEETVEIDLSDEILNAPAPEITVTGFVPGETVTVVEGAELAGPLEMTVSAAGKVNSATLRTQSATLLQKGWPEALDFATADASVIALVKSLGLKFPGLEGVKSRMAMVDFTEVVKSLAFVEGSDNLTTFTLVAKDDYTKVSEPVTLTVKVEKLELSVDNIAVLPMDATELTFDLLFNGGDPARSLRFQLKNERGMWSDVEPISITPVSRATETFRVVLPVSADGNDVHMRFICGGNTYPEHVVTRSGAAVALDENNVFATHAMFTVAGSNAAGLASAAKVLVSTTGADFSEAQAKTVSGGDITLTGLNPSTKYYAKIEVNNGESNVVEFTTEAATQLPNAGMEEWCVDGSGRNWQNVYAGTSKDAAVWGTNNPMTTSQGSNYAYCRISGTISDNAGHTGKAALIRSVGWGKGNTAIGTTEDGAVCKYRDAGLLHLGASRTARPAGYGENDHGGNGPIATDDLECGIDFASRPSALSFWYKYSAKNSADAGVAEVWVKNADGDVIASGMASLPASGDYTQISVPLTYARGAAKGARIYVKFLSTGDMQFLGKSNSYFTAPPFANLSDGTYLGSQLHVDDIELKY